MVSQTDELTKVKARIRALTDKTVSNGCTEAEAMAAAEMVGRLLERYALSMDEVEVRAARCVQVEAPIGGRRRRPIDGCVPAIARFCDCKVWLARGEASGGSSGGAARNRGSDPADEARYVFFGFEMDASLALYLFAVIGRAIDTELDRFRARSPGLRGAGLRQASTSFQNGLVGRVAERLEAMHAAREASVGVRRQSGTALILARHRMVEEAFRETKVRLRAGAARADQRVDAAFRQGWEAGDRVDLGRPVGGGGERDLLS